MKWEGECIVTPPLIIRAIATCTCSFHVHVFLYIVALQLSQCKVAYNAETRVVLAALIPLKLLDIVHVFSRYVFCACVTWSTNRFGDTLYLFKELSYLVDDISCILHVQYMYV